MGSGRPDARGGYPAEAVDRDVRKDTISAIAPVNLDTDRTRMPGATK